MWRAHGVDRLLYNAWQRGKVLCGISAGMICWFRDGLTDSFGSLAPLGDGLGFVDASACPHYDSEPHRPEAFRAAIVDGMADGYAADDGAALHFGAGNWSKPSRRAETRRLIVGGASMGSWNRHGWTRIFLVERALRTIGRRLEPVGFVRLSGSCAPAVEEKHRDRYSLLQTR